MCSQFLRSGSNLFGGDFRSLLPKTWFEQVLNEDKAEIGEYVLEGLKMPYKIEFRGARCRLPTPRPEVDYATRGRNERLE
jgi:hypothetical protein